MLLQLLLSSLIAGCIYALMALAMSITYKASEIPNFAQGEMSMFSTYLAFTLLNTLGWPPYLAFLMALGLAFALGLFLEFILIRRAKDPTPLSFIIITIGFQMVLYGLAGWKWGPEQRRLDLPFEESRVIIEWGEITLTQLNLVTLVITAGMVVLLYLLLQHTRLGLAMKASQQNALAARANGVPTNRVLGFSFGLSALVGGLAGLLVAPLLTLDPAMMWDPLLKGFAAAVLGGMKSLPGVFIGALLLAVLENLFGFYISIEFKSVVAFSIIVLILFFKPAGLFGRHYVRKV
ncbi:MAG: branched-chain amino acid ABC transporter permease [Lewinellaceae bacterium]|nr:branched-chain amino acid ABC transporter permease [Lewinellaceae bacterium]